MQEDVTVGYISVTGEAPVEVLMRLVLPEFRLER